MDTLVRQPRAVKILLETRPALDKHAGIPQQTRLLFRGLALNQSFTVEGLLQSSTHALGRALPPGGRSWWGRLSKHRQIDRLARVVIMLEQKFFLRSYAATVFVVLRRLCGLSESLTRFETRHFRDFIWRRLFARTLPAADFDTVTSCDFRVAHSPWTALHICGLIFRQFGLTFFPRLNTAGFDVMITDTPYPAVVTGATRLIVRYHDAIPLLMPHTISDRQHHQAFHYRALRQNVASGAWFACVSEATRQDLLSIFPEAAPRAVTIHNMVSHDYFDEASSASRVREIVRTRLNARIAKAHLDNTLKARLFDDSMIGDSPDYLLVVSTIEPRKNHLTLLSAWERYRAQNSPGLRILIVGSLGWHHRPIVQKLVPWLERGEVFMLEEVPSPELRLLYKHARATICPSFAEGFDLSGVEAMRSGGVVIASDIPVHREIYSNAAEFFNPYSVDDLGRALRGVIDSGKPSRREELVALGAGVAERYSCEVILPKWHDFLTASLAPEPPRTVGAKGDILESSL